MLHCISLTKFVSVFITFVVAFFYFSPAAVQAATLYWVGAEGANASVASNWSTTNPTSCSVGVTPSGTAPGPDDQMNFDADCDNGATIDAGFGPTVNQIAMASGYTGTVILSNPLTVANNMIISGGTFTGTSSLTVTSTLTLNNAAASINFQNFSGVDLNSTLTISAGTFNAPSGIMTLAGALTITNHPATTTFNNNNGTIIFDGGNVALSCNNVEFNLVVLAPNAGITKTIGSECNLPLGNDPGPILGGITLNGTLSGSGTLTKDGGLITMNTGAQLSGFNGLSVNQLAINGANVDLSAYSTFVAVGAVCVGGTTPACTTPSSGSLSLPNGADLNNALNIAAGTFTAPSGNMTIAGNLTISGSPTFNANGGTIIFDGTTTGNLTCNNVVFNLVAFTYTAGIKTINSDCNLPLGNNPVIPMGGNFTLNGTLSGTGTLTKTGNTFTLNTGATLVGFNGLSVNQLVINGADLNLSSYTTFEAASTVCVGGTTTTCNIASSGSLTLPNGADLNGALLIPAGTFNAPSGTMTLAGSLTISGSPTFNHNNGTIVFDGAGTLSCNNVSFHLVQFNNTGSRTVNSNCELPLGHDPISSNDNSGIVLNGTLTGSGTFTKTASTLTLNPGSQLIGFSGMVQNALQINGADADFGSYSTFVMNSTLTLNSGTLSLPDGATLQRLNLYGGTLNAPNGTLILRTNFDRIGGVFNHNNGTIVWQNSPGVEGTRSINFSNTFYNLTILTNGTPSTRIFAPGTTQTILNNFIAEGDANLLTLQATSPGNQWNIDAQGSRSLSGLSVQDSNNINANVMFATNSIDGGNNTNWYFSDGSAPSFSLVGPQDTSYISNPRPGFKWQAATTTAGGSINNYVLQMNNGAIDGNWELLDIPAYWGGTYVTSKYIASYEGFGDGDPSNNYITVTTQSSTDWGPMENDGMVAEGSHSWQVTAFDTVGNSTRLSKNILMDLTGPTTNLTQIPNATLQNGQYTTLLTQPTFYGTTQDSLHGTPVADMIASGPQTVTVYFNRQIIGNIYVPYTTAQAHITQTFWTDTNGQVDDNFQNLYSKYSPFSVVPQASLLPGTYQVTMVTNDQAGNTGGPTTFTLRVGTNNPGVVSRIRTAVQPQKTSSVPQTSVLTPSPTPNTTPDISSQPETTSSQESTNTSWWQNMWNSIRSRF